MFPFIPKIQPFSYPLYLKHHQEPRKQKTLFQLFCQVFASLLHWISLTITAAAGKPSVCCAQEQESPQATQGVSQAPSSYPAADGSEISIPHSLQTLPNSLITPICSWYSCCQLVEVLHNLAHVLYVFPKDFHDKHSVSPDAGCLGVLFVTALDILCPVLLSVVLTEPLYFWGS